VLIRRRLGMTGGDPDGRVAEDECRELVWEDCRGCAAAPSRPRAPGGGGGGGGGGAPRGGGGGGVGLMVAIVQLDSLLRAAPHVAGGWAASAAAAALRAGDRVGAASPRSWGCAIAALGGLLGCWDAV
jgi:hypothetical protein